MTRIEHPDHKVPDEVALFMSQLDEAENMTREWQSEIARLARPNKDERQRIAEIRKASAQTMGLDWRELDRLSEDRTKRAEQKLRYRPAEIPRFAFDRAAADWEPIQPEPEDPTFWWAETQPSWSPGTPSEFNEDGFLIPQGCGVTFNSHDAQHFFGGVYTHDGDNYRNHVGLVALFELQPERIPRSGLGLFRSTPHVELSGSLSALTGSGSDDWCHCWLHLDQKIIQNGMGREEGTIVLAEAHETQTIFLEEGGDRVVWHRLKGFQWMPPVTFGGIGHGTSLFARLEIRFGIETEGAGSILQFGVNQEDSVVTISTFQWPLTAL